MKKQPPVKPYVKLPLELEPDVVEQIHHLSKHYGLSIDVLVQHALVSWIIGSSGTIRKESKDE